MLGKPGRWGGDRRHAERGDLRAHVGCRGLSLRCGGRQRPGWPPASRAARPGPRLRMPIPRAC